MPRSSPRPRLPIGALVLALASLTLLGCGAPDGPAEDSVEPVASEPSTSPRRTTWRRLAAC